MYVKNIKNVKSHAPFPLLQNHTPYFSAFMCALAWYTILCKYSGCTNLTDVTCYAKNVPSTDVDAFKDSRIEYATLHVPSASVNAYRLALPWKTFKSIEATDGPTPEILKCEKPTISYVNGQLQMSCATEGVEYVTEITDADVKKHYDATISLSATYNISVYATKSNYENYETATATLC